MTYWRFGNTYFDINWGLTRLIMIFTGKGATTIITNWGLDNTYNMTVATIIMILTGRGREETTIMINWGFDNIYFDTNWGLAPLIMIFTGRGQQLQ